MSTASPTSPPTTDPWFQDRFAERIGGAGYGKGTEVYKFELIKRAKRLALAEHPERKMLDLVSAKMMKWHPKVFGMP